MLFNPLAFGYVPSLSLDLIAVELTHPFSLSVEGDGLGSLTHYVAIHLVFSPRTILSSRSD